MVLLLVVFLRCKRAGMKWFLDDRVEQCKEVHKVIVLYFKKFGLRHDTDGMVAMIGMR